MSHVYNIHLSFGYFEAFSDFSMIVKGIAMGHSGMGMGLAVVHDAARFCFNSQPRLFLPKKVPLDLHQTIHVRIHARFAD